MQPLNPAFPTPQHASAADAVTALFANDPAVEAVLLMGSCARGKASAGSCVDILVLVQPEVLRVERDRLDALWQQHYPSDPVYQQMLALAPFSHVDFELIDGDFDPNHHHHGWTSGADEFELEVGNILAYSVPLWQRPGGLYYPGLLAQWLPYYHEDLRRERLAMVLKYCRNNLAHIAGFAQRGLYFQSFKRFYHAFEEFLQALFIARCTYPIAYDKWVKEGVDEILGLPELYARLPHLLEIQHFESLEIVDKAKELEMLVDEYCAADK